MKLRMHISTNIMLFWGYLSDKQILRRSYFLKLFIIIFKNQDNLSLSIKDSYVNFNGGISGIISIYIDITPSTR